MTNVVIKIADGNVVHGGFVKHVNRDWDFLCTGCTLGRCDDDFFDFSRSERRGAGCYRHHGGIEFFQSEHGKLLIWSILS